MTAQMHERLIVGGKEMSVAGEPKIPEHPRIVKVSEEEVNASGAFVFTSACWRNYIGSWEISDSRLYLIGITGIYKLIGEGPLFADWFSGILRVPAGPMRQYVHMGYASTFERELYFEIRNGIVVSQREETW